MTIHNNGKIFFSLNMTKEQQKTVLDLFQPNSSFSDVYFDKDAYTMRFDEYFGADLTNTLNTMLTYCQEWGVYIVNAEIAYYGDYEGCYVLRDGIFVDLNQDEVGVYVASDNDLRSELARRTGRLFIPVYGNPGYFIDLPRAEAEAAYRYIRRENLFHDALAAVKAICDDDDAFKKAFGDLCTRLHGHENPSDNLLLRRSPVIEYAVTLFDKNASVDVPERETWKYAVKTALKEIGKE